MLSSAVNEHGIHTHSSSRAWAGFAGSATLVALSGMGLIWMTQQYVRSLDIMAATSPDAAILRAGLSLKILVGIMAVLALGTSIYIVRSCRQVLEHRQLPPPGARVIGNPRVMVGRSAVLLGWTGYALAAVLVCATVAVTALMWQFVDLMMSGIGPI
jgi:hypothetical protein